MITLYTFGPYWGLPDGSPFVVKAMMLLKLAGLEYREDRGGYGKAPKGKLPFIDDDGEIVADSTLIRFHLDKKHGKDLDGWLSPEQRGIAWAVEKMLEDHLYWALIDLRWCDNENFAKGPAQFFRGVPGPVRPIVQAMVRRKVRKSVHAHGLGRHMPAELAMLAIRDIDSVAAVLGDRPWLMGDRPCWADAAVYGMISGILVPIFESPILAAAARHANLLAYVDRVTRQYFGKDEA